ncbi:hypothetical protein [Chryseobacterium hagamense]|uniref:Uncharacterized protein n=1 Tax=Chryseobacterium hagamense TaxID=395935 RepID=A0A511YQJ0_9FLAO|nr:hypothetical protein [Chryseobacterium hagamense]GEN77452.1 hypothetical protein CHA01nite_31920 [Chryseobacterium hagamense]
MDFGLFKAGAFIVLIIVYLAVRKFFKKLADFTENMGTTDSQEEELILLKSKVTVLEEQLKHKP